MKNTVGDCKTYWRRIVTDAFANKIHNSATDLFDWQTFTEYWR